MPLNIAVPIDTTPGETRIPVSPLTTKKLTDLGFTVTIETGAGTPSQLIPATAMSRAPAMKVLLKVSPQNR